MNAERFGTIQNTPAQPVAFYNVAGTVARCWCQATIKLRVDGEWTHGAVQGLLCREVTS